MKKLFEFKTQLNFSKVEKCLICASNIASNTTIYIPVTDQNLIQEEIKRRLNSGNACYQSVQKYLSSRLLSKKGKNYNILYYNFACCSVWV
jgi:uncharacterized protein YpbB